MDGELDCNGNGLLDLPFGANVPNMQFGVCAGDVIGALEAVAQAGLQPDAGAAAAAEEGVEAAQGEAGAGAGLQEGDEAAPGEAGAGAGLEEGDEAAQGEAGAGAEGDGDEPHAHGGAMRQPNGAGGELLQDDPGAKGMDEGAWIPTRFASFLAHVAEPYGRLR
jgi:hypothetical protein